MSGHHQHKIKEKKLGVAIILNLFISVIEIIGGFISGSISLISDAVHNFSDTFSLVVSLIAVKLSRKDNTLNKTFGYRRAEILAALLNSSILLITFFFLIKESISRLLNPQDINSSLMIIFALIAAGINIFSALLLKNETDSLNIKSSYLHLLSDAFFSVSVIIGGTVIYFFDIRWLDPFLSVFIGLFILKAAFAIFSKAVNILMMSVPDEIKLPEIKKEIEKIKEVKNIHHVHIWPVTEKDIYFEGHIDVDDNMKVSESCILTAQIKKILTEKYFITHATIQVENQVCKNISLVKNLNAGKT
ncbi:MAG: cation diffusion facilitator family transporter [Elusimicrobia bacterium]|jgi:cobalt-zinc-cadmium efflux system protein|nr:cation diffusion facilitator family transporter [Elusimicrobiota bacterium]